MRVSELAMCLPTKLAFRTISEFCNLIHDDGRRGVCYTGLCCCEWIYVLCLGNGSNG
jgi:hypothetical protein